MEGSLEKSKLIENIFSNIPNPEKYALISEYHEKVSYKDLLEMTKNICMCMRENTVALLVMNNDLGSVIFYLASLMVGVVPIIVDKTVTKQEMKQPLRSPSL